MGYNYDRGYFNPSHRIGKSPLPRAAFLLSAPSPNIPKGIWGGLGWGRGRTLMSCPISLCGIQSDALLWDRWRSSVNHQHTTWKYCRDQKGFGSLPLSYSFGRNERQGQLRSAPRA